jgi:nucleoside-diphosphate-sugar epimerase
MRIFVAGAAGAIGKQLVPMLVQRGHDVTGTTRGANLDAITAMGAKAVRMDGLDPESVANAVAKAEPDVVVHQLTALGGDLDLSNFEETFAETSRLRSEGTDHLLSAARAVGARRFVAQSFAGWPFKKTGGWVKSEEDPLDHDPPEAARSALEALFHLEDVVTGAGPEIEGIVLRYGGFYGPGTSLGTNPDGEQTEMVRKRRFPIIGTGQGHWSLIHITDAATATVAAIEYGAPGIYNIADDDPAPVAEFATALAAAIGAKAPRHIPAWLGRLLTRVFASKEAADIVVMMMEESRGASNEKARRELRWEPYYSSWRTGVREGLASAPPVDLGAFDRATV